MRRADRLSDLLNLLRGGGLHRAEDLAAQLGVSARTIYRDMDALMATGVPITGTRGEGYRAQGDVTLPPLTLDTDELEALHLALELLGEAGDDALRQAASALSAKIDAALPEDGTAGAFGFTGAETSGLQHLPLVRSAIRARQKLLVDQRVIRPLLLDYRGRAWFLTCWCETSGGFDTLRLDRIGTLRALPGLFVDAPGQTLADFRMR